MSDDDEALEFPLLAYMKKNKIPLTRQNYLDLAYGKDQPHELDAEEESILPPMFQVDNEDDDEE